MKQSGSDIKLAFQHVEDILNAKYIWPLHFDCNVANGGYFMFFGNLPKLATTFADIQVFY